MYVVDVLRIASLPMPTPTMPTSGWSMPVLYRWNCEMRVVTVSLLVKMEPHTVA
jgi:hypothetical protein